MNLKNIITVSLSALMLAGIGAFTQNTNNVSASQPAAFSRYTNGRYSYYYPYIINNVSKRGRILGHAERLYKPFVYNAKVNLMSPRYGQKAAIAKYRGQKYYLVMYFPEHEGKNGRFLNGTEINDSNANNSYDGHHELPNMGYINAKDFMKHKARTNHAYKHHKHSSRAIRNARAIIRRNNKIIKRLQAQNRREENIISK